MTHNQKNLFEKIFKDDGGRFVLFQWPNFPLFAWIVCRIIIISQQDGSFKSGVALLGSAFLFTWAYLELTKGINYFRKSLGFVVLLMVIIGMFT